MPNHSGGLVAIVGAAGAIGRSTAAEFDRRGIPYRVIGRSREKLEEAFGGRAEIYPANLAEPAQIDRALTGAEAVVYTVGIPYPEFRQHPVLARNAIEAAKRTGVSRFALVSSVYSYGAPRTERVAETHPREPKARKGQFRKEQEDVALAADNGAGLRTLVLRLPDFYGPHAELSLADQVFQGAMAGKAANWLGSPDLPHEFVFVPDVGAVIAGLLARDNSFGQAWNYGGPGTITGREFITTVYRTAGLDPKFRTAGPLLIRLGGIFNPMLRELVELIYLGTTPLILDDSKLSRHLGALRKTPHADGIRQTVEWYRSRKSS